VPVRLPARRRRSSASRLPGDLSGLCTKCGALFLALLPEHSLRPAARLADPASVARQEACRISRGPPGLDCLGTDAAISSLRRAGCQEHLDEVLLRNVCSTSQSGGSSPDTRATERRPVPHRPPWREVARWPRLAVIHARTASVIAAMHAHRHPERLQCLSSACPACSTGPHATDAGHKRRSHAHEPRRIRQL
jgi:hypothetical protein